MSEDTGGPATIAEPIRPVQRELRDFLRVHEQRRRLLPRALLVGLIAGAIAVGFARTLELAERSRDELIAYAHGLGPMGAALPVVFGAIAGALAVFLVVRFAPEAGGSGIPHLKAVLHRLRGMTWWRILPVKFVGGAIGIGGGFALGREGPTVQMGGAVGQMVAGWFRSTPRERNTLIAAGAGAGLSAAFNAPIAGLVFVLEEVQRDFSPAVFTITLVASVVADVTCRSLLGDLPVFHVEMDQSPSLASLPLFLLLGVLAAPLGILFNQALIAGLDVVAWARRVPGWLKGALVGAAIGLVGWFLPWTLGGGGKVVAGSLLGDLGLAEVLWLIPLRLLLTSASYATGAAGGIFTPMLAIGAVLGAGAADVARLFVPADLVDVQTFAVVGMAAFFTAVVRAPLTAIVLLVEMTGDYEMALPLLVACLVSGGIADYLRSAPIYEALLLRDLARTEEKPELGEPLVIDLNVGQGAPFDGAKVRDLGLPPGSLLIAIHRGVYAEVPTADFVLCAGDRISVLVYPQAAKAVPLLREGTDPPHGGTT